MQTSRTSAAVLAAIFVLVLRGAAYAGPPPHDGTGGGFINPANVGQPCTPDCTEAGRKYLRAIGVLDPANHPTGSRKSLEDWKTSVGFGAKVSMATAGAAFFNKFDLAFGRDAHCVLRETTITPPNVTVACYITNYSTSAPGYPGGSPQASVRAAALQKGTPLFTVTMEVHTGGLVPQAPGARPDVTFIAYDANGAPMPTVQFDHEPPKPLPGVCINCHGYTYDANTSLPHGGTFLPFNAPDYVQVTLSKFEKVDPALKKFTAAMQEESFRQLNTMVLASQPSKPVRELITGWYKGCGGVYTEGCKINGNFVPGGTCSGADASNETCGWSVLSDLNRAKLYTQVIRPYCRNCHLAWNQILNVESFQQFLAAAKPPGKSINSEVLSTYHNMPYAEVPYVLFWNNSDDSAAAQMLKTFLSSVGGL